MFAESHEPAADDEAIDPRGWMSLAEILRQRQLFAYVGMDLRQADELARINERRMRGAELSGVDDVTYLALRHRLRQLLGVEPPDETK